uniref:Transposase n=1 Tax=Strongyloides venezuelensis TaxID=75913 RepID=A0A0K0EVT7_STRVS
MPRMTKYQRFINEPMFKKKISDVPGIGRITAEKFVNGGITEAIQLYLLYKLIQMNDRVFIRFLTETVGMSSRYAIRCTQSLSDYEQFHGNFEEFVYELQYLFLMLIIYGRLLVSSSVFSFFSTSIN